jgi:hypothetical protein
VTWPTSLISKVSAELTSQQVHIVDTLKRQRPGSAVMRKLVFSFRAILRGGKVTTPGQQTVSADLIFR